MALEKMVSNYNYSPLTVPSIDACSSCTPGNRQIRLIELLPGSWLEPIRCDIDVVDFDNHPPYEALSYVWGDNKEQVEVQLCGRKFEVTQNLWLALRRLRDSRTSRTIWIDAICINQKDHHEKSHQVAFMGETYSKSDITVIWLVGDVVSTRGEDKSDTAIRACATLGLLATDMHLNEVPLFVTSNDQRTEINEEYAVNFEAFREFVDAEWWKRIWIVQEMVLPKRLRFHYASEEFAYSTLRSVIEGLQKHGTTCCKQYRYTLRGPAFDPILTLQEQIEPMIFTRETWTKHDPMTLARLRRQFAASKATKKCDRFYALIGLVTTWGSHDPLFPDYGISQEEALAKAVFRCISQEEGLGFLHGERIFRADSTDDGDKAMPSWIPDAHFMEVRSQWVIVEQRRLRMYSTFSASGNLRQDHSIMEMVAGNLQCQTIKVGNIIKIGPVCEALEHFEKSPDIFRQWMEMVGLSLEWPEHPPAVGTMEDVFWRTMLNDSLEVGTGLEPFYRRLELEDYAEIRGLWGTLLSKDAQPLIGVLSLSLKMHDDLMSKAPAVIYHIFVCLWHRRLIQTEQGWIGLAPENCKEGDEVHVVPGSSSPFILRSIKNNRAGIRAELTYRVVGNAYVHNIMRGEAAEKGSAPIQVVNLC